MALKERPNHPAIDIPFDLLSLAWNFTTGGVLLRFLVYHYHYIELTCGIDWPGNYNAQNCRRVREFEGLAYTGAICCFIIG